MGQLAKNRRGYLPEQPPNYQKSKKISSTTRSGCLFEAIGLQVDARSRNGPEKVELRMDFGSLLGGQIKTNSTKKTITIFGTFFEGVFY